jgi:hypothetical protein
MKTERGQREENNDIKSFNALKMWIAERPKDYEEARRNISRMLNMTNSVLSDEEKEGLSVTKQILDRASNNFDVDPELDE